MSVLKYLFKDKAPKHESAGQEGPAQAVPAAPAAPAVDRSAAQGGGDLDFDQIRGALDQIAEVLGRGDGYDMLRSSGGDVTAVELPLLNVMEAAPAAFSIHEPSPADEGRKVTVLLENIFDQLSSGKMMASVANVVADVPAEYLVNDIESLRGEMVSLPLPLVVGSISPEELRKRTTNVERDTGINDLPNLFNPASLSAAGEEDSDQVVEEVITGETVTPQPEVAEAEAAPAGTPAVDEVEPVEAETETVEPETQEAPAAGETPAEEPVEEPVAEEETSVAEELVETTPEPVAEEPAREEPVTEEQPVESVPVAEEPAAEEPAVDPAPVAEEPSYEVPVVAEQPTEPAPAAEEPAYEKPVAEEQPVSTWQPAEPEKATPAVHTPVEPVPVAASSSKAPTSDHVLHVCGLDLNSATADELVYRLDGVGPRLAERIVHDREVNGPYLDILDLARVPGLGRRTFQKITGARWPEGEEALPEIRGNILSFSSTGFLSVKDVAYRFGQLPGFAGCVVAHQDGYVLATSWEHTAKDALGAFAPQIFKKVARYVKRLDMGDMDCMTVILDQCPITFVPSEDIYFVAIHDTGALSRKHVRLAHGVGCRLGRLLRRRRLNAA